MLELTYCLGVVVYGDCMVGWSGIFLWKLHHAAMFIFWPLLETPISLFDLRRWRSMPPLMTLFALNGIHQYLWHFGKNNNYEVSFFPGAWCQIGVLLYIWLAWSAFTEAISIYHSVRKIKPSLNHSWPSVKKILEVHVFLKEIRWVYLIFIIPITTHNIQ